jgi:hypothetical protein
MKRTWVVGGRVWCLAGKRRLEGLACVELDYTVLGSDIRLDISMTDGLKSKRQC